MHGNKYQPHQLIGVGEKAQISAGNECHVSAGQCGCSSRDSNANFFSEALNASKYQPSPLSCFIESWLRAHIPKNPWACDTRELGCSHTCAVATRGTTDARREPAAERHAGGTRHEADARPRGADAANRPQFVDALDAMKSATAVNVPHSTNTAFDKMVCTEFRTGYAEAACRPGREVRLMWGGAASARADTPRVVATPVSASPPQPRRAFDVPTPPQPIVEAKRLYAGKAYKTALCTMFEATGACNYGTACRFAHGVNELRSDPYAMVDVPHRHPKYKTKLCNKYWTRGYCSYGSACNFIHDKFESALAGAAVNGRCSPAASRAFRLVTENIPSIGEIATECDIGAVSDHNNGSALHERFRLHH